MVRAEGCERLSGALCILLYGFGGDGEWGGMVAVRISGSVLLLSRLGDGLHSAHVCMLMSLVSYSCARIHIRSEVFLYMS